MCDECWREFRGWCKSFTLIEAVLTVLEAVLLAVCVGFFVFLIGHFIVCAQSAVEDQVLPANSSDGNSTVPNSTEHPHEHIDHASTQTGNESQQHSTLSPHVNCTWKASSKTEASARYYVGDNTARVTIALRRPELVKTVGPGLQDALDQLSLDDQSDGEEAPFVYSRIVLALAKRRGIRDPVFGCPLTVVSEHWALTAASCLDAVEETDVLDAYMMVERWDGKHPQYHDVSDVRVHPRYSSQPKTYDTAVLRSPDRLLRGTDPPRLPSLQDYFLITIGERFSLLGFGSFRSLDSKGRELREVHVYSLPPTQCSTTEQELWSSRHLSGGRPLTHGACVGGCQNLCAGVLYARGAPCGYCAGTPLLRGQLLLGIAAAAPAPCGEACDPMLYVNLALLREWIEDVLRSDDDPY